MSLLDLGEDVLVWHVASRLSARDILHLSLTSQAFRSLLTTNEAYHLLYSKVFGSNTAPLLVLKYNWERLFRARASKNANVYTWGSDSWHRLGHPRSNADSFGLENVSSPKKLEFFNEAIITDLSVLGYSFQFLTSKGELYWTGLKLNMNQPTPPGPRQLDYDPPVTSSTARMGPRGSTLFNMPGTLARYGHNFTPTRTQVHLATNPDLHRPVDPAVMDLIRSTPQTAAPEALPGGGRRTFTPPLFVNQLHVPPNSAKIVSVASGREHVIALDENGSIFQWDWACLRDTGVKLAFGGQLSGSKIFKIASGWYLAVAQFETHGLVVWYGRQSISKEQFESENFESAPFFTIIPGTQGTVTDFSAGSDYILFIKDDGLLYRYNINAQDSWQTGITQGTTFAMKGFNDWLKIHNEGYSAGNGCKFSKLSGCFNSFAVFTDDGLVLLGENSGDAETKEPDIKQELQNRKICHITMGDYHHLALTDDGELLAWGRESKRCGCLGVGLLELDEIVTTPRTVNKPSKSGKWLAVAAAGWHSCAIFADDIEEKI